MGVHGLAFAGPLRVRLVPVGTGDQRGLRLRRAVRPGVAAVPWLMLWVVASIGCTDPEPDYGDDWVGVTYQDGSSCVLTHWELEYSEAYTPPTRFEGARVTIPISPRYDRERDTRFRAYGPSGERLDLARNELVSLRFRGSCEGNSCRVESLRLESRGRAPIVFRPVGPRNSQRALMPAADHFWPRHYSGDHRRFDGVGLKIVGTPVPGCAGTPFVSLTSIGRSPNNLPTTIQLHAP